MKAKIFLFLSIMMLICAPFNMVAQKRNAPAPWKKEFKEFKIRYLAQEIELRDDQKSLFVPLYTQMMEEKDEIMKVPISMQRRLDKMENASDEDYRKASEAMSNARIKENEIDQRYEEKFKQFLTPKQMYKLKEGERKFRDKLVEMQPRNKQKSKKRSKK
jgi:Spy/CpxP family protein refolding chaperone